MIRRVFFIIILLNLILEFNFPNIVFCVEEVMRDPFIPQLPRKEKVVTTTPEAGKSAPQVTAPKFTVQGMVWDSDKPQAIIDNKIYNLGDEINGAKIIEINKEGVKVIYQSNIFVITPETISPASKK